MKSNYLALLLVASLAACATGEVVDDGSGDTTNGGSGDDSNPDAGNASAGSDITNFEPLDEGTGGGYVASFTYDDSGPEPVLIIDGLAFDGDNGYARNTTTAGTIGLGDGFGNFELFDGPDTAIDDFDGAEIAQFLHRAIRGVSDSGATEFAIARTGGYVEYGFGGYVYLRDGSVTLPTSGQADYAGDYGGIRVFLNASGLQYVTGDMYAAIDFEDFNNGDGVRGYVTNRQVWDSDGSDATEAALPIYAELADTDAEIEELPDLIFRVGPGTIDDAGQVSNEVFSLVTNPDGIDTIYESGNYYGVLAGDNAEEFAGVIVVTGQDPAFAADGEDFTSSTVTYQETGGFILYRDEPGTVD